MRWGTFSCSEAASASLLMVRRCFCLLLRILFPMMSAGSGQWLAGRSEGRGEKGWVCAAPLRQAVMQQWRRRAEADANAMKAGQLSALSKWCVECSSWAERYIALSELRPPAHLHGRAVSRRCYIALRTLRGWVPSSFSAVRYRFPRVTRTHHLR